MALKSGKLGPKRVPFAKVKELSSSAVLIVEPQEFLEQVPIPGKPGEKRDVVNAYVTAFPSITAAQEGRTSFTGLVQFTNSVLVKDLHKLLVEAEKENDDSPAAIVKLGQWKPPTGGNAAWIFKEFTEGDEYEAAAKYYEARAEKEAQLIADAPDFD